MPGSCASGLGDGELPSMQMPLLLQPLLLLACYRDCYRHCSNLY